MYYMTNEEAINTIKTAIAEVEWYYPMDYAIAFEIAISALEKQIPKKLDLDDGVYCPCCLHEFKANYDTTSYCPNCGQAIDWSDTK